MSDNSRNNKEETDSRSLIVEERNHILTLPSKEALDAIINSPRSTDLVQSFPEEDLYLLINEIGIEDSLPLLSMASNEQWTYILDMEIWQEDRMEIISFTRWLNHLLHADPNRLVGKFFDEHFEDMELYLFKNVQVLIREHDQDPSELGEDCFTLDNVFYLRFIEDPEAPESNIQEDENRKDFLLQFLQHLADYDHIRYQKILFEAAAIIPAESEEETYRLRNVRLAEKGFLPFDEAIGIYQPLSPNAIDRLEIKQGIGSVELKGDSGVSLYPITLMEKRGLFAAALDQIETNELLQQIQAEFAGLSNQVVSADKLIIEEREQLEDVVRKVTGYLSIGLEELTSRKGEINIQQAAHLISIHPLSQIFRVGYGLALALKWKAHSWQEKSWPAKNKLPLSFWGEEWLGVLGGLLIKKPLYYDNYQTGVLYREFSSLEDIKKTDKALNDIITFDELLSLLGVPEKSLVSLTHLSYKNLVLTLWARHHLALPPNDLSITRDEFKSFLADLWSSADDAPTISDDMKADFINWFSNATGLTSTEILRKSGKAFEMLFAEIESEYGKVSIKDIDPRYIYHFLLKK